MTCVLEQAKWIWCSDLQQVNAYVDFVTRLSCTNLPREAQLYISADSGYAVYLNGSFVPGFQYPDYPQYKVYDCLSLTAFLQKGDNVLAIEGYCQNQDSSVYRKGKPGLIFAVVMDGKTVALSGSDVKCRSSRAYQSGMMEKFSGQLSFAFRYDARNDDGWKTYGIVPAESQDASSGWSDAVETGVVCPLYARPVDPLVLSAPKQALIQSQGVFWEDRDQQYLGDRLQKAALGFREVCEISDCSVLPPLPSVDGIHLHATQGDGIYLLLDLGRETAGYLELDLELPQSAPILIGFGEHLEDLRVRSSVGGRQFAVSYTGCSDRQLFLHPFKRIGGRYLQVHMQTKQACIYHIGVRAAYYPVVERPLPACSDSLHQRIAQVCRDTLKLCMHEHYEDCPWREQALYAMDGRNQMLCGYVAFENKEFVRASLHLLALGQQPDGLLELCAPARVAVRIPSFSLSFIMAVREYVDASGDLEFARTHQPCIEQILAAFRQQQHTNGLVACFAQAGFWNFYEWQPGLDGNGCGGEQPALRFDAPLNGMLIMALEDAAKLERQLGMEEQAVQNEILSQEIRFACGQFWDPSRKLYATFLAADGNTDHQCQLSQALMILAGVPDDEQRQSALQALCTQKADVIPVTLSCSLFKYQALLTDKNRYGKLILQDIADIWGGMLMKGATSFWETAKGASDFDRAGSLCHGWSAVPLYVYDQLAEMI